MKEKLLSIFAVLMTITLNAQNFEPLENKGKLPEDFVMKRDRFLSKYHKIKNLDGAKKKDLNDLQVNSTQFVTRMLQSGYVIGSGEIYDYLNKVKDEIIKYDKKLAKKVQVYPLKSAVTNAFTTSEGFIFVTLGLLSQLENEAQLAFILSHEVAHFTKKHHFESLVEETKIKKNTKKTGFKAEQALLKELEYSREHEVEADKIAFENFAKSKYSYESLDRVYDVLRFGHTPIDLIPFDYSIVENGQFKLPPLFKTNIPAPYDLNESRNDIASTHPSIPVRKENFEKWKKKKAKSGKNLKAFIVSKAKFDKVAELARHEMLNTLLVNRQYDRALYHASIIRQKYGENEFIDYTIGKILYAIAKYSNYFQNKKEEDMETYIKSLLNYNTHIDYRNTSGYLAQVTFLTDWLYAKPDKASLVAINYLKNLSEKYPERKKYIDKKVEDLIVELAEKRHIKWDDVKPIPTEKKNFTEKELVALYKDKNLNKYDKIELQDSIAKHVYDYDFARNTFADFKDNNNTKKIFDKNYVDGDTVNTILKYSATKDASSINENTEKVSKTIIVKPYVFSYKAMNQEDMNLRKTLKVKEKQLKNFSSISKKLKKRNKILDTDANRRKDLKEFNDMAFLYEYVSNRNSHPKDLDITDLDEQRLEAIRKKYKTNYIHFPQVVTVPKPKSLLYLAIANPLFGLYYIPMSIGSIAVYDDVVINCKTHDIVYDKTRGYFHGLNRMKGHYRKLYKHNFQK